MKLKTFGVVLVALALALILNVNAQSPQQKNGAEKPSTAVRSRVVMKKPL